MSLDGNINVSFLQCIVHIISLTTIESHIVDFNLLWFPLKQICQISHVLSSVIFQLNLATVNHIHVI